MAKPINLNPAVSEFLDALAHPLRNEIDTLRRIILHTNPGLAENIKWNGPNYYINGADRITMRVQPPKQLQLIFHRGAKVQEQPKDKLVHDTAGMLLWKENDRAIATFKSMKEIEAGKKSLQKIIQDWLMAAS